MLILLQFNAFFLTGAALIIRVIQISRTVCTRFGLVTGWVNIFILKQFTVSNVIMSSTSQKANVNSLRQITEHLNSPNIQSFFWNLTLFTIEEKSLKVFERKKILEK